MLAHIWNAKLPSGAGEREAEKERERERRREQEAARRWPDKQRDRQKALEKENEKKPARTSSGETDRPARGNQPGPLRDSKEKAGSDREVKPVSRPVNGTTIQNHRSPPVHLKSDVDAKTRAGIVKNGPVINVRTVQAKAAAAAAAAKTNHSAPGVRPPAVGLSTTNAWANGPLPGVRKAVTPQKPATPPLMPSGPGAGSGGGGENGSGGSGSAWFGSAWATPWAKIAAAGTEAAGPGPSTAVSCSFVFVRVRACMNALRYAWIRDSCHALCFICDSNPDCSTTASDMIQSNPSK